MSYAVGAERFLNDKNLFFSHPENYTTLTEIDTNKDYEFILTNQKLLHDEFEQLFAVLKAHKDDENNRVFWFYCYYCASLLEAFHDAYGQKSAADKYREHKLQITNHLEKAEVSSEENTDKSTDNFIEHLYESFKQGFAEFCNFPFHVSKIRSKIGLINMYRIYYIFTRLTLTQALTVASELQLIAKLEAWLGIHIDVDKIIFNLQMPGIVSTYLSVGLFAGRFLLNAGMLIKHTFFPTDKEKENGLSTWERFKYELEKRHFIFLNDIAWATVNFLTNFAEITNLGGVSVYLVSAFLTFDVMMMVYKTYLEEKEYLIKRSQYDQELSAYFENLRSTSLTEEQRMQITLQIEITTKQKAALERKWLSTQATMYFNVSAATLLAIGFTATILVTNPVLIIGFYFIALVGVAMYLSSDAYNNYKMKSLVLQDLELANEDYDLARVEFESARKEFFFTLAKNTFVPMIIIGTLAACWPAAVVLATLYIGYGCYQAYSEYKAKQVELPPEEVDDEEEELVSLVPSLV